jgi:hypothetical protein
MGHLRTGFALLVYPGEMAATPARSADKLCGETDEKMQQISICVASGLGWSYNAVLTGAQRRVNA